MIDDVTHAQTNAHRGIRRQPSGVDLPAIGDNVYVLLKHIVDLRPAKEIEIH